MKPLSYHCNFLWHRSHYHCYLGTLSHLLVQKLPEVQFFVGHKRKYCNNFFPSFLISSLCVSSEDDGLSLNIYHQIQTCAHFRADGNKVLAISAEFFIP